jgi:transcriptional regulator with XRE-family HTH domain
VVNTEPTLAVGQRPSEFPTASLRTFGEFLKRLREKRGVTQAAVASRVGVRRATFAQWETGRHLPAVDRMAQLDEFLGGDGELIALARRARPDHGTRAIEASGTVAATPPTQSLLQVFFDVRGALLGELRHDEGGRPLGWRHNLGHNDDGRPTTDTTDVSTAYGLKTLGLLGGPHDSTPTLVDRLLGRATRDGRRIIGWAASVQRAPRLEATATVLDALLRMGADIPASDVVEILEGLVDPTSCERPFILTTALEPVLRAAPDSTLAEKLVTALMSCRHDFDGVALWPEQLLSRDQRLLDPSVVHTARSITVLRSRDDPASRQAVADAEAWLIGAENLDGVSETIRRAVDDYPGREDLAIEHFTSAWVLRALAGTASTAEARIDRALDIVWSRYDQKTNLWAWGNGDVPTWMVHDAVAALHATALASHRTPVPA